MGGTVPQITLFSGSIKLTPLLNLAVSSAQTRLRGVGVVRYGVATLLPLFPSLRRSCIYNTCATSLSFEAAIDTDQPVRAPAIGHCGTLRCQPSRCFHNKDGANERRGLVVSLAHADGIHRARYCIILGCQAMRQATNREKAAKIAEKDPFGPVDEQLERSAASEEVNTTAMAQVSKRGFMRGMDCDT